MTDFGTGTRGPRDRAALEAAADGGDAAAMYALGQTLFARHDEDGAQTWFRRAAEAGVPSAMNALGLLLSERAAGAAPSAGWFDDTPVVAAHGTAADGSTTGGDDGDDAADEALQAEAETWFRRAAEAGHAEAMANLGLLLGERGEEDEAEVWLSRADAVGAAVAPTERPDPSVLVRIVNGLSA